MVTGRTANPQEAMLQPAALQVLIKFSADESEQVLALAGQFGLELGPVFTDDLVEQGGLGAVAYVSCRRVSCECKPVPQTNTGSIRFCLKPLKAETKK